MGHGPLRRKGNQPDLGITAYTKALELAPNNDRLFNNRGNAYRDDDERAIADFG
jgi:Flp pilus assembly protein TadD